MTNVLRPYNCIISIRTAFPAVASWGLAPYNQKRGRTFQSEASAEHYAGDFGAPSHARWRDRGTDRLRALRGRDVSDACGLAVPAVPLQDRLLRLVSRPPRPPGTCLHGPAHLSRRHPIGGVHRQRRPHAPARRRTSRAARPHRPRRRTEVHRAASPAGQAPRPRAHREADRSRHRVPGIVTAGGVRALPRRRAGRGGRHRHRTRVGPRRDDRRQRRHGEGRHLLPAHRQEAPARAGSGDAEPPALRLPGGLGRRLPAAAGRSLSRPRSLRPDLLQPGAHVGRAHPADRRRDGLVHRGRRLRAGDVGRDDHRQGHGHHLPRRSAAGEGGDRRRSDRGGSRRRGCAHPAVGRRRLLRRRR